ncbi:MAG: TonB-dependent receptor plug domain-containing protein [Bacteroidetes bacterium]|nr:TonB-dependent receptor plug domain-containing protein [Bacteroidota bacterium]
MLKEANIFLLITFLFINNGIKGQSIKINGKLFDKDKGNTISNGVIFLNPGNQVTTTDTKGEYSFTSPPGRKQISTKVLGYNSANIRFEASSDTVINIYVQISPYELNEVTITGDSIKNVVVTPHGSFIITPAAIRETPKLFSEPDLLKSFQLLPGIVSGKDGTADIYVRGGGTGQNIILANGCYFFLPNHLLGFASPYDLDFLESAEMFKDYFPSELGGGASSVISLDFKKPHSDSLRAQLRLGLLSSGITMRKPEITVIE